MCEWLIAVMNYVFLNKLLLLDSVSCSNLWSQQIGFHCRRSFTCCAEWLWTRVWLHQCQLYFGCFLFLDFTLFSCFLNLWNHIYFFNLSMLSTHSTVWLIWSVKTCQAVTFCYFSAAYFTVFCVYTFVIVLDLDKCVRLWLMLCKVRFTMVNGDWMTVLKRECVCTTGNGR